MRQPVSAMGRITLFAVLAWASAAHGQSSSPPQQDPSDSPAPKKVYTNDDLKGMQRQDVSVVGNNRGTGKSTTATAEPKNRQYWHNRAQKLRNEMAEVDRQIAQMKSPDPVTGAGLPNSPSPSPGTNATSSRPAERLQRLQNRKAQLQQQMDQLEDEARRAGIPPGWLR